MRTRKAVPWLALVPVVWGTYTLAARALPSAEAGRPALDHVLDEIIDDLQGNEEEV